MRSLRINFSATGGCSLVTASEVSGFEAVMQNALVFCGCSKASDTTYPDRGTELLRQALDGELGTLQAARHAANFASLDCRDFSVANTDAEEVLEAFSLAPNDLSNGRLILSASGTSNLGNTVGLVSNVPI
jgi:hypothetical protein